MGWEERDWAQWTDEERERFYGAPVPLHGPDEPKASWLRILGGTLVGIVVVGAVWLGILHWTGVGLAPEVRPPRPTGPYAGLDPVPVPPGADVKILPDGSGLMCTQRALQDDGSWKCTAYRVVPPGSPNLPPPSAGAPA